MKGEDKMTPKEWFSNNNLKFKVPVYQRLFTWDDRQFDRLLNDLREHCKNCTSDVIQCYYLGIVTTVKVGETERILVDGQQRLTVISILTAMLSDHKVDISKFLAYEARPDDAKALKTIFEKGKQWLQSGSETELLDELNNNNITSESMRRFIVHIYKNKDDTNIGDENLKGWNGIWKMIFDKLTLLISELPEEYRANLTLQNEYFEKMNSAGKQLEPHEILKVRVCGEEEDSSAFDKWNAVEDFTKRYEDPSAKGINEKSPKCLRNAVLEDVGEKIERKGSLEKWRPSLIDFPMFLLHVLNISLGDECGIPSDSHRLLEHFNNYHSKNDNFLGTMVDYRKFLDHWVIHREIDGADGDGGEDDSRFSFWMTDNRESTYVNEGNEGNENEGVKKKIKQIQMALYALEGERQEWLRTAYLAYKEPDNNFSKLKHLYIVLRNYLIEKSYFVVKKEEGGQWQINSRFQVNIEEWPDDYLTYEGHMRAAFICLDYFLWLLANSKDDATLNLKGEVFGKDGPCEVITRFVPRANRSIEHFHPQTDNSSQNRGEKADNDTTKDGWGAMISSGRTSVKDIFGNLALISAGRNSEYSNMPVGGKADLIVRSVEKKSIESIKLLLMKNACLGQDKEWLPDTARAHAKLMKKVVLWGLRKAGYISDTTLSPHHTK